MHALAPAPASPTTSWVDRAEAAMAAIDRAVAQGRREEIAVHALDLEYITDGDQRRASLGGRAHALALAAEFGTTADMRTAADTLQKTWQRTRSAQGSSIG